MNRLNSLGLLFGLTGTLLLGGCGSSGQDEATALNGDLEVAITDAEEDFLSYQIELDAIFLNRADGTQVSVLPLSTEVDFVQYQELSELFAVLSVPAGTYTGITLSLDYTDADIVIQDEAGASYQATAVDGDGNTLTTTSVELQLNDNELIRISPFKAAQLTLDLDLAASNAIESFEPAIVSVEPFMIGTTYLDEDREHRVRGLLEMVNEEEQEVTLNIRPMRLKQGQFGQFTLQVDEQTRYEIDGVEYEGLAGLTIMAELPERTPVVAFGSPEERVDERNYLATIVHAGSSVAWSDSDVLKGLITARTENTLTLKGAVLELEDQAAYFRQTVTLNISEQTDVTAYRLGDANIANLSIGQRVLALGAFDATTGTFNAEEGTVRMQLNRIVGEVTQASPLQLDLSHINKRPVDTFDFSGTGGSEAEDSNPDAYQINTSDLDISGLEAQEWIQVRGYPGAFGSAPMDFDALSIIDPDFASHPAKLHALWSEESTANVQVENSVLTLNADAARMKLHLRAIPGSSQLGFTATTIENSGANGRFAILLKPDNTRNNGRMEMRENSRGINLYRQFSSFSDALAEYLQQGYEVVHLTAAGQYSDTAQSLDANYVTVRLSN